MKRCREMVVIASHGPSSVKKPPREEQPGPPFNLHSILSVARERELVLNIP